MQTITVDMTPGFRQPTIHYSQNDVGTTFAIDLRSRFGDTLPASPTVKIQATKPSGFGFSIEADSVVGSVATFTTVDTMTDEAGRFQAELEISEDSVVLYTANFYMEGEANPHPIGTTDGSQETIIPTLTLLVERVEAAAASVLDMTVNATTLAAGSQATYSYDEDTNTATFGIPQGEAGAGAAGVTASAYSSSSTYTVGDYVIHDSNLYRCTTAITTAEAFTAAHWTQVVLGDDVCDLKSDIDGLAFDGVLYAPYQRILNKGFNTSTGATPYEANWDITSYIPVTAGETIHISNGKSTIYNGFYEADKTFIGSFTVPASSDFTIEVPEDGAWMILTNSHANFDFVVWRDLAGLATRKELTNILKQDFFPDKLGTDAVKKNELLLSGFVLDASNKTVSITKGASDISSATTGYCLLEPKLQDAHNYVLAIKFTTTNTDAYIYVRNLSSAYNVNGQQIVQQDLLDNNEEKVYTFTASGEGWLALGVTLPAYTAITDTFKFALYDVTDCDISNVDNSVWLTFADEIDVNVSGILLDEINRTDKIESVLFNTSGEKWSALGDSLTATGSGSQYLGYVKDTLGLSSYKNCGIGGTFVSGAESSTAMYQDVRIETLDIDSQCVTILGGTNDCWQEYYKDHPNTNLTGWGDVTRENHDVSTFVGAYNVMLSKILYKFCKVNGYYNDVDYSGITQMATAIDNFRLILITPPQRFYSEFSSSLSPELTNAGIKSAHSYVKQIAEMWGLPCVDTWEMGLNDMNKALFFTNPTADATHINSFGHERLASLLIDKAIQVSRYK